MGYNVALTMGNAKKVDLVVESDSRTVPIQVKALAKKQNVGWPLNLKHQYDSKLIFVLVVLGAPGSLPDYYVVSGKTVTERMKKYTTRAILNIADVREFKDNWKLIDRRLRD